MYQLLLAVVSIKLIFVAWPGAITAEKKGGVW